MMNHILSCRYLLKIHSLLGMALLMLSLVGCQPVQEKSTLTVLSLSETTGVPAGGSEITIFGSNLSFIDGVKFDQSPCTDINFVNESQLTCTVPAHAEGVVTVRVYGRANRSGTATYTYAETALTLSSFSPSGGDVLGGSNLVINGTGFVSGATVTVGGLDCTGVVFTSSNLLNCAVPANAAGDYTVVVTNPDTSSVSSSTDYSYDITPVISSISPTSGFLAGGGTLTLTGTGFLAGASVTIGGVLCTLPNVVSSTSLTCTIPAKSAWTYNVTVTNLNLRSTTLSSAYTYIPAPTISSVIPAFGPITGGNSVTLIGTGFLAGAGVTIGGVACTSVIVISPTMLSCTNPANAVAGPYSVVITNTDTQSATKASGFTYIPPPVVTSVSPTSGQLAGGGLLTMVGTGFSPAATVTIGGASCFGVSVTSATSATCFLPAKAASTYDLVFTNPDLQTGSLTNAYTYQPAPTVTSVTPLAGALAGGTAVTIAGTGFLASATIDFGGSPCSGVVVNSSTSITCTTTTHIAGSVTVTATNTDAQTGNKPTAYTYQAAPTVSSVSPSAGALAGGTAVTITGTGFLTLATIDFGGSDCTGVVVNSPTSITCTTTANAGAVTVTATNTDAQSGNKANGYTYQAAPTVSSVSPLVGALAGATAVTITGTGFLASATIDFGGSPCSGVVVNSPTSISCTTTSHGAGAVTVTATNADAQTGSKTPGFTYQAAPVVTSLSITSGLQAGGAAIIITGSDFLIGAIPKFGTTDCSSIVVNSSTSITCVTPAHVAGAVSVTVLNTDGQTGSSSGIFTYTAIPIVEFQVGVASPNPPKPDSYGSTITNVTHTFTLVNTGEEVSTPITMAVTGVDASKFLIGTDNCTGNTLAIGATCTVQLTFLGATLGTGSYIADFSSSATSGGSDTNPVSGSVP